MAENLNDFLLTLGKRAAIRRVWASLTASQHAYMRNAGTVRAELYVPPQANAPADGGEVPENKHSHVVAFTYSKLTGQVYGTFKGEEVLLNE